MAENFTAEQLAEFSPEQRAEIERMEKAVDSFLADRRAIHYVESDANKTALLDFLDAHNLEVSHPNLLFGYNSLCAEGTLELIPLAPVGAPPAPVPTQPPAPIPSAATRRAPTAWRNGQIIEWTSPRPL